jgi:hypothetical protein
MDEPLNPSQIRKVVRQQVASEQVFFTNHALEEMKNDGIVRGDIYHVLRAGQMKVQAEFEKGSWRYRIETRTIAAIIAFDSDRKVFVVTAWRYQK